MNPLSILRPGPFAVIAAIAASVAPAQAADDIVIGASLPLSGPLAGFGAYQKWGYENRRR